MELAATAFAAISAAAPEILATAGTAATTAAETGGWVTTMTAGAGEAASGLAGAGSGMLSSLQGYASVGSNVAQLLSGGMSALGGVNSRRMADLNAHADELASEAKAIDIKRQLVKQIGDSRVAFAAGGMDIGSGAAIESGLRDQAQFQTDLARTSGEMGAISKRMAGANAETAGYAGLIASAAKAAKGFADYNLDLRKRG